LKVIKGVVSSPTGANEGRKEKREEGNVKKNKIGEKCCIFTPFSAPFHSKMIVDCGNREGNKKRRVLVFSAKGR
jgi:hypothetical protein